MMHFTVSLRLRAAALLGVAALSVSACATRPPASDPDAVADYEQTNDPLEPTNRFFYKVNDKLEQVVLKPVTKAYVAVLPQPARTGIHNVLVNLDSPVTLVDDVSQGNVKRAAVTVWRFVVNSTAGVGGIFDVAAKAGLPGHRSSFAITLGAWGVPAGPYLYVPLIGPSSPRDLVGYGADVAADPFTWVPSGHGLVTADRVRFGFSVEDKYSRFGPDLDKIKAGALDPYATLRSLYRQNLQAGIEDAKHPH